MFMDVKELKALGKKCTDDDLAKLRGDSRFGAMTTKKGD